MTEFDEAIAARAIRAEIARGGQVYWLHNRVETIPEMHAFLQRLVPEASMAVGHGQLDEEELEEVMRQFVHGERQVLLSTTIIENGLDIPNVNTIIIDRADMLGVAQLYQLRGRVGRAGVPAYAYLFYPDRRALSEIAMKRLRIISDHTELGSGFKIALKDLEIRGAGNILGREQHGQILSVGFDLYLRMLDDAVARLRNEQREEPPEPYLELEYSGFIPDAYIAEPMEKMDVYKRIASVSTQADLDRVTEGDRGPVRPAARRGGERARPRGDPGAVPALGITSVKEQGGRARGGVLEALEGLGGPGAAAGARERRPGLPRREEAHLHHAEDRLDRPEGEVGVHPGPHQRAHGLKKRGSGGARRPTRARDAA